MEYFIANFVNMYGSLTIQIIILCRSVHLFFNSKIKCNFRKTANSSQRCV